MGIKIHPNEEIAGRIAAGRREEAAAQQVGSVAKGLLGFYMSERQRGQRQQANAALAAQAGIPTGSAGMYDQGALLQLIGEQRRQDAQRKLEEYQQGQMNTRSEADNAAALARVDRGVQGDVRKAQVLSMLKAQQPMSQLQQLDMRNKQLENAKLSQGLQGAVSPQDQALIAVRRAQEEKLRHDMATGGNSANAPLPDDQALEMAKLIRAAGGGPGPRQLQAMGRTNAQSALSKATAPQKPQGWSGVNPGTLANLAMKNEAMRGLGIAPGQFGSGIEAEAGRRGMIPGAGPQAPVQGGGIDVRNLSPEQKQALLDQLHDDEINAAFDEADQQE